MLATQSRPCSRFRPTLTLALLTSLVATTWGDDVRGGDCSTVRQKLREAFAALRRHGAVAASGNFAAGGAERRRNSCRTCSGFNPLISLPLPLSGLRTL